MAKISESMKGTTVKQRANAAFNEENDLFCEYREAPKDDLALPGIRKTIKMVQKSLS
ncbi:hypothetical protein [Acetonema longum]|uniref:Uncharacterized protein n=1 Tax=Acetonema longum DSM 6540 TaxID=1009370 RepID=F7NK86_9FIRM|nr:hypothetical protein [Acetonema longum]EGO63527.1 hypothetical protein ALO_12496 [Acetonema longum DSM 6540]